MIRLSNRLNDIDEVSAISLSQDANTDIILTLCGKKLGYGSFRSVYEFNMNPSKLVVKIERNNTDCNISEFMLWDEIQGLKNNLAWVKEWFAPIHYCSPNGKVLIMEKTKQLYKERPKKVPCFFTDIKVDNFGWIGNKFVCHDYGFINKFIKYQKKYQNAKW